MNLDFPHADDIDSLCHALDYEADEDIPPAVSPRCKGESKTWFVMPDGRRVYVCEDHALEPFRFPGASLRREDLPDDYHSLRSLASDRGITLQNPTREELESRLLSPPDPDDLDDHPTVIRCPGCGKFTFTRDTSVVNGRCPACEEGVPELDPRDHAVTTPPG